jgi:hypothetical protein
MVGVKVGHARPATTVRVAISAGDNASAGKGVQVGSGVGSAAVGVGVGSPTISLPTEQPRLVISSRSAKVANQMGLALVASWVMGARSIA